MKKRDLYSFKNGLNSAKFEHPRVTYAVNKNKRLVDEVIKDMEKYVEESEQMKAFAKEREELAKKHCVKNDKGDPQLKALPGRTQGEVSMVYDIPGQNDVKSVYRKALAKIEAKFKEEITKHEKKVKTYNEEFLDDDTEYKPFMVDLELLEVHEKCPQNIMDLIHWMIREPKD